MPFDYSGEVPSWYEDPAILSTQQSLLTGKPVDQSEFQRWYESQSGYNRPYAGENQQDIINGLMTQNQQAFHSGDFDDMLGTLLATGAFGGMAAGAALGGAEGTLMPPAISPSSAGYAASAFDSAAAIPATEFTLTDPNLAGTTFGEMAPGAGFPNLPPGASTLAQQLVKALTGSGSGDAGRGLQGFMQGGTPATQGYVRKARPSLTQPAFLGEQGQQPLGSAEDTAFNEMVAGRGEDTSTRARQMAAQLRGRPGFFGFRSG